MTGVLQEDCILADSESLLAGQIRLLVDRSRCSELDLPNDGAATRKSFSLEVSTLKFYQS